MSNPAAPVTVQRAGVLRRLAAILYDILLLLAVLIIASGLALPFTHGKSVHANNPVFTTYLFLVTFFFFAWFWTHGGQTLGMRAWRLRLQLRSGKPMGWWHALLRFITGLPAWLLLILGIAEFVIRHQPNVPAIIHWLYQLPPLAVIGLGVLWLVWDQSRLSGRDRFTETTVVRLPNGQPAADTASN